MHATSRTRWPGAELRPHARESVPRGRPKLAAKWPSRHRGKDRLAEQRRALPDQPGVYLFRDARGRVIYVGKAKSIRKRVASHFSARAARWSHVRSTTSSRWSSHTEAEALLAEQNFIKQYRPRFNIRLRDDKSYPYIAIRLDEDFPRVYFTRERHRRDRVYFGPYSSAKRVRGTLDLLGQDLPVPLLRGRRARAALRLAVPGLLHQALRGALRRLRRPRRSTARGSTASSRSSPAASAQIERDLERRMYFAAGEQDFEQAALERNRLQAVRALLERQRVATEGVGTFDAVAVAVDGHGGQRAGLPGPRRRALRPPVLLPRQPGRAGAGDRRRGVPPAVLHERAGDPVADRRRSRSSRRARSSRCSAELLAERRGGAVEIRAAERGDKRRILELAERNARLALDQEKLKAERRRQQRVEALDGLQAALGLDALPVRIECFDISQPRGHAHRRLDGRLRGRRAEEGRLPALHDPRPSTAPTTSPRWTRCSSRRYAQWERQRETSPHDAERDDVVRRAAEPRRHRRRPGPALGRASRALAGLPRARRRRRLAGQADRGGLPARACASRCGCRTTRRSCSCCSACATRRTASRSPTTGSAATRR